ncbi:pept-1 [Pristionchus pacificus]|uniref:Oligopeptide transporter 1 n=1 Tax=Pristionchus pacificus TaxID=54126 RepID=A0A2A6B2J5_PRIPA|nr:pept-1 [Pristionchus pacificus]|eukprot:PDM60089.1 pept-1 [Pristionchus pacificus]
MCWDDIVLEKHDMRGSELIRVEREGREKRGRDGDMRNIVRKGSEKEKATMTADSKEKELQGDLPAAIAPPRDGVKIYTTWPEMIKHWPKTTLCIVSNEFCERFSYYGMRTVLTFYILNVLKFPESTSTIFFNAFSILCYLTPLLGSIIADGYIGKFWTIFSVSILYTIGQITLAIASTQNWTSSIHPWLDLTGLVIIGFGTGGIKPCVSAFGADQFDKGQERMLSIYFSMFYFSINAGSMISTFISPIFRAQPCLGQDSCYPLSFGVPAVLMVVATIIFMIGSPWYRKNPPTENVFGEIARLVGGAISNKFSKRNAGPTKHWLEHYLDTHNCENDPKCMALKGTKKKTQHLCQKKQYVADVVALFKLIIMFLPVPMFWALYDQQGSIWLLQGIQMDCDVFGILLLPDQMQTLNAVLILVFIPLFQVIVYPLFSKCFNITPLRKMVIGGWLASLSFLITGFVQLQVNNTLPQLPGSGVAYASFMNVFDAEKLCNISVWHIDPATNLPVGDAYILPPDTSMVDIPEDGKLTFHVPDGKNSFQISYDGKDCGTGRKTETVDVDLSSKSVNYIAVGPQGTIHSPVGTTKPTDGTGEFSMGISLFTQDGYNGSLCVCRLTTSDFDKNHPCNPKAPADFYYWEIDYNQHTDDRADFLPVVNKPKSADPTLTSVTSYQFKSVKPGKWGLFFLHSLAKDVDIQTPERDQIEVHDSGIDFEINGQGGVYNFPKRNSKHVYQVVQDNKVNILWQVPQIVVITAGEILFSITGYEFAYSQSAPSMKSVVQALWLLTTAIGDSIIVLITALDLFDDMAVQFFAYAGIMFIVICIYALMAIFYFDYQYYTKPDEIDDDDEEDEVEEIKDAIRAHVNEAFHHELDKKENPWGIEDNISVDIRM